MTVPELRTDLLSLDFELLNWTLHLHASFGGGADSIHNGSSSP